MIRVLKWNYETGKYDQTFLPGDWYISAYETDMDTVVNCPGCGKKVRFGETYTSRVFHTPVFGMGYGVCGECNDKEFEEEKRAKGDDYV